MLNKILASIGGFLIGFGIGEIFFFNNFILGALCILCGIKAWLIIAIREKK